MKSFSDSYKEAGVDITAGYTAVELMKSHIARTMTANVLSGIGGFGGLYGLDLSGISQPVLVAGTDGVGTKLKLAFLLDKHDTVGIDCVAMWRKRRYLLWGQTLILFGLYRLRQKLPGKDCPDCCRCG